MNTTILDVAMESGQILKDALQKAEEDKVALQLRIANLEASLKTEREIHYKLCGDILVSKVLLLESAKTSVELKLKCVEGERDRYKEERDKAEETIKQLKLDKLKITNEKYVEASAFRKEIRTLTREVNRLQMLLEAAERGYASTDTE